MSKANEMFKELGYKKTEYGVSGIAYSKEKIFFINSSLYY